MVIQEFLPNPRGKDMDGEYIALRNDEAMAVSLRGWVIKDASGKTFRLDAYTVGPNEILTLPYATTRITLNNSGETLFLYDAAGTLLDTVGYEGSAAEGRVVRRTTELTPELRAELLEPLAQESFPMSEARVPFSSSFALTLVALGILSASFAIFLLKKSDAIDE